MSDRPTIMTAGIVRRLRIVFVSIALAAGLACMVTVLQLNTLQKSARSLTGFSVPVFVEAEEVERLLKTLLLHLQEADQARHTGDLAPLRISVAGHLGALRHAVETLSRHGLPDRILADLDLQLSSFEDDTRRLLETRNRQLELRQSAAVQIDALGQRRKLIRDHIETLTFLVADGAQAFLSQESRDAPASRDALEQSYSVNLSRVAQITELSLETEAIFDAVLGLRNITTAEDLDKTERAIVLKLSGVSVLLSRMPASAVRTELAEQMKQMHTAILEPVGLLETVRELTSLDGLDRELKQNQRHPIEAISAFSGRLKETARRNLKEASLRLEQTRELLVLTILAASVALFLGIAAVLYFIVERQINRRMARLTHAVLAIADGETDHDVRVDGPDELGRMARALEVFKANARELKRSNTELEKFAYVAAHDLRSPLRGIQDLAGWVIEDPDTRMSEETREFMEMLQARIRRMSGLLTDLLAYSRVGKEEHGTGAVALDEMVQELRELLDPVGHYDICYRGLEEPVVTFQTPLRHILLNLITNAIKHHDREAGRIEIEARLDDGVLRLSVSDDGPGIAPEYHERIFALFQTLKPRDDVEGSGLGLAIIRKSLEHYGGAIEVRSDPGRGRGTRFDVRLPARRAVADAYDTAA